MVVELFVCLGLVVETVVELIVSLELVVETVVEWLDLVD